MGRGEWGGEVEAREARSEGGTRGGGWMRIWVGAVEETMCVHREEDVEGWASGRGCGRVEWVREREGKKGGCAGRRMVP